MKYALLNMDLDVQGASGEAIINIGSVAMRLGIYHLLLHMGIKENDIIQIKLSELNTYDGEYVIMPINMHWMQDVGNKKLLSMSSRIKPVFLSISFNDTMLDREQVNFLKTYEPIGCRDDRTMYALKDKGIDAFVFGCIAGTFETGNIREDERKDVVFADVPYGVLQYVPDSIKKNIHFVQHEFPVEMIPEGMSAEEYTKSIIEYYRTKVRLVVTSRFHGAVIPMSFGIPVIVVNESYTFRFSWLRKIAPFYTQETFADIDWNPEPVDFAKIKEQMRLIAEERIRSTEKKYELICNQSAQLENYMSHWLGLSDAGGAIDYFDEALEYIKKNWSKTDRIDYAFWGVNNNAEAIYQFITAQYPNAKLVEVYDSYKSIEFYGIHSIKPAEMKEGTNNFIFVTTFVAGYIAKELFDSKKISEKNYFICQRHYISERDII